MSMRSSSPSLPLVTTYPSELNIQPHQEHSRHLQNFDYSPSPKNGLPGEVSKKNAPEQKPIAHLAPNHELDIAKSVIYGSFTVPPPSQNLTQQERKQRIDDYANRVVTQIKNIEGSNESTSTSRFLQARQFFDPAGYFSGGLLAAGYDPHEKITVTFNTYVGKWKPEVQTNTEKRTYFAWEIAAGALKHDRPPGGGLLNFQEMEIEPEDRTKINILESLGAQLQGHWKDEIAKPMRDESGPLAKRSGKADAYVVRGTLQSLVSDKDTFEKLSNEGQEATRRTLDKNGQVIIPNIYGYPLAGYAFIPYTPFDGHYKHRPDKGLMIDLKNGTVREIKGDKDFSDWAKNNRSDLLQSFNARDRQGGKDAHWPKAGDVLDNLIAGNFASYPGYQNLLKDKGVPVQETFNYTEARGGAYRLKYGDLDTTLAAKYHEINASNAVWSDQTEVFGSSQQTWKAAKELWGRTFGYFPILGNAGNIYFGVHDSIYGMTADDRVGGNAAAVISGLQLAHELAPSMVERIPFESPTPPHYNWRYNEEAKGFDLVRRPETSEKVEPAPVTTGKVPPVEPTAKPSFPGMREIEFRGEKYFVADKPDDADGLSYLLHVQDPNDPSKLVSTGILAAADKNGLWKRRGMEGGWPWQRKDSPPSPEPTPQLTIADQFLEVNGSKMKGAEKFDPYLNLDANEYKYGIAVDDKGQSIPQISWTAEEDPTKATPHPTATASTFGTSDYSEQFIKDINRSKFTLQTPDGIQLEIDIGKQVQALELEQGKKLSNAELDAVIQQNIEKFEKVIPDPALRAKISEVANQWLLGAAPDEFQTSRFKGPIFASGRDPHYYINYDPAGDVTTVTAKSDFLLTKLDENNGELDPITDLNVKASRTITLRSSNEIDSDGYEIDPSAPTRIEITPNLD